ncbi:hypothetical protein GEMRC1_009037 [Eukaryota sp. GEM-RC1]
MLSSIRHLVLFQEFIKLSTDACLFLSVFYEDPNTELTTKFLSWLFPSIHQHNLDSLSLTIHANGVRIIAPASLHSSLLPHLQLLPFIELLDSDAHDYVDLLTSSLSSFSSIMTLSGVKPGDVIVIEDVLGFSFVVEKAPVEIFEILDVFDFKFVEDLLFDVQKLSNIFWESVSFLKSNGNLELKSLIECFDENFFQFYCQHATLRHDPVEYFKNSKQCGVKANSENSFIFQFIHPLKPISFGRTYFSNSVESFNSLSVIYSEIDSLFPIKTTTF